MADAGAHRLGRSRRDRQPARALPQRSRQGPATSQQFAAAHRVRRALPARVAAQPSRGRLREPRRRHRASTTSTDEQAYCFADPNGPNFSAMFLLQLGYLRAEPRAHRGVPHGSGPGLARAPRRRARRPATPSSAPATWPSWCQTGSRRSRVCTTSSPRGARVADIGCGFGLSSVLIAQANPEQHRRRVGLPRRVDRGRRASRPRRPGSTTG